MSLLPVLIVVNLVTLIIYGLIWVGYSVEHSRHIQSLNKVEAITLEESNLTNLRNCVRWYKEKVIKDE